jgi:hypothetical protein
MEDILDDVPGESEDPEKYCAVCGKLIQVKKGVAPKEGEKYYIVRENSTESGFVFNEKWIHGGCFTEYYDKL